MVALIPARAGSKRVIGKNTRRLAGHPLVAYTIAAAQDSNCFSRVCVVTDDYSLVQWVFEHMNAQCITRSPASDAQRDIEWLREFFDAERDPLRRPRSFAILRPTSPFRTAETIRRAFREFTTPDGTHDSLRAVEPVKQHPGKMWTWEGPGYPIRPLLDKKHQDGTPWHSSPTQSLPTMYVQNASLEMGFTANIEIHGTIHGRKVIPFFTEGHEGFDINTEDDWQRAEALIASGAATLPPLPVAAL